MTFGAIPQAAPSLRIARYRLEIDEAISSVLSGNSYILGSVVETFERSFANYIGASHCVGVASGTDALWLALRAVGVRPGDEVITTALTAAATAQAILLCGARPVFVDVDPETRCLDPGLISTAVTDATRAIVPVHLFGFPAGMHDIIREAARFNLRVVEDCAQSHGAHISGVKTGTFGDAAAFSFYPTKNLGGVGDGGAVVSSSVEVADSVRRYRSYGWKDEQRISHELAGNSRLAVLQAAILNVLLPYLEDSNAERREIANAYRMGLSDLNVGLPVDAPGAVYHQFAITTPYRDKLMSYLRNDAGIQTAIHYFPPLHHHPAFSGGNRPDLPETERLSATLMSLPTQPEIAAGCVSYITDRIRDFSERNPAKSDAP